MLNTNDLFTTDVQVAPNPNGKAITFNPHKYKFALLAEPSLADVRVEVKLFSDVVEENLRNDLATNSTKDWLLTNKPPKGGKTRCSATNLKVSSVRHLYLSQPDFYNAFVADPEILRRDVLSLSGTEFLNAFNVTSYAKQATRVGDMLDGFGEIPFEQLVAQLINNITERKHGSISVSLMLLEWFYLRKWLLFPLFFSVNEQAKSILTFGYSRVGIELRQLDKEHWARWMASVPQNILDSKSKKSYGKLGFISVLRSTTAERLSDFGSELTVEITKNINCWGKAVTSESKSERKAFEKLPSAFKKIGKLWEEQFGEPVEADWFRVPNEIREYHDNVLTLNSGTFSWACKPHLYGRTEVIRGTGDVGGNQWVEHVYDPRLEYFAGLFVEYHEFLVSRNLGNSKLAGISKTVNPLFHWILSLPEEQRPLKPEQLSRRTHLNNLLSSETLEVDTSFFDYLDKNYVQSSGQSCLSEMHRFFSWYQKHYNPLYAIPFHLEDPLAFVGTSGKSSTGNSTNKLPIPTRVFNLMKEILLEAIEDMAQGKAMSWPELFTGEFARSHEEIEGVWEPCHHYDKGAVCMPFRALFMLTMLELPLRYDNVATADTGFADEMVWSEVKDDSGIKVWKMIQNPDKELAQKGRNHGIFRIKHDVDSGADELILGFTNNKTTSDGLEVLWVPDSLRKWIPWLQQFIKEHGGVRKWHNDAAKKRKHQKAIDRTDDIQVLFLNWSSTARKAKQAIESQNQPVPRDRMQDFMLRLVGLAEFKYNDSPEGKHQDTMLRRPLISKWQYRHLNKSNSRGIVQWLPAGSGNGVSSEELKIIIEQSEGEIEIKPIQSCFTIHCLRVTGITNFALAGVPPHIIAEFLSGHASVIMNLYYTVLGPSMISRCIDQAAVKISTEADLIPLDVLSSNDDILADFLVAGNPQLAAMMLNQRSPNFWHNSASPGYWCPNQGKMCSYGLLQPDPNKTGEHKPYEIARGGPVPTDHNGNPQCSRCHFKATGPMLLNDLVLAVNDLIWRINELDEAISEDNALIDGARAEDNLLLAQKYEARTHRKKRDIEPLVMQLAYMLPDVYASRSLMAKFRKFSEMAEARMEPEAISAALKKMATALTTPDDDYSLQFEMVDSKEEMALILALSDGMGTAETPDKAVLWLRDRITRLLAQEGNLALLTQQLDEQERTWSAMLFGQFMTLVNRLFCDIRPDEDQLRAGEARRLTAAQLRGDEPLPAGLASDEVLQGIINIGCHTVKTRKPLSECQDELLDLFKRQYLAANKDNLDAKPWCDVEFVVRKELEQTGLLLQTEVS